MWMNTFEVCEDNFSVEAMAVRFGVGDHRVGDVVFVFAYELGSAPRALLLVAHDAHSKPPCPVLSSCV
jgi:hypothetical protein